MNRWFLPLLLVAVFGGGVVSGLSLRTLPEVFDIKTQTHPSGVVTRPEKSFVDRLSVTQSSSSATTVLVSTPQEIQKNLRSVPFALLKEIYLERQDEQWVKLQERYPGPKETDDAALDARAGAALESFQRYSGDQAFYMSRGEWSLRGGRSVPYVAFVQFYSIPLSGSSSVISESGTTTRTALNAMNGREHCYLTTIYFKVGDKYERDGNSNCLAWLPLRNRKPFAILSNYGTKSIASFYDSLALALPGFGPDDVSSEWFDGTRSRWASLGAVRWESVSRDEYVTLEREMLGEKLE